MRQLANPQGYIETFLLEAFRAKVEAIINPAVKKNTEQALDSFVRFLRECNVSNQTLDENLVFDWVGWLLENGYSPISVHTYVARLSALYSKVIKAEGIKGNDCFSKVKSRLRACSENGVKMMADRHFFIKLRALVQADYTKNFELQLGKDLVLFSLYNGGLTFSQLADYRKDDYVGEESAINEIVERYTRPRNKYLFPLNHSERTIRQRCQTISTFIANALRSVGIELKIDSDMFPAELWAAAAKGAGMSSGDIKACIGDTSEGYVSPFYSYASMNALSEERKSEVRDFVTKNLSKNPDYWYAMQFRPHVDFDMIKARMNMRGIRFHSSFYPMEEIVRRIGKKLIRTTKPVVPGLMFFKTKSTDLADIFYNLGDLAWGYRSSRGAGSAYAIIPDSAIDSYQRAIGQFTDSVAAYPDGHLKIEEGDKVEIIGGELAGCGATFEKEICEVVQGEESVERVIYRLRLVGYNNISWIVDLDPRLVKKI